jgi:hypothetical protein
MIEEIPGVVFVRSRAPRLSSGAKLDDIQGTEGAFRQALKPKGDYGTLLKTMLTLGLMLSAIGASAEKRTPIGTNVNAISYSSTELPFVDIFKSAGRWVSGTLSEWEDKRRLDLDARGWVRSLKPGQVANMGLFHDPAKSSGTLARRYQVRYEGTGTLEYPELAKLVERREHGDIIEIESGNGNAVITLTSTDPDDYLRNIRITPEGAISPPGEMFNPVFLKSLKGYRALRFSLWMLGESADAIAPPRWNARPLTQDARWSDKGVPIEVMVALSNRLGVDPWFSLPHEADDDYARRFAEAVAKSLDPSLKVYLEYSNEVWNDVFPGTTYARERGLALKLSQDPGEAVLRFYAKRSVEIFKIWEKALGRERLVRVLSFQSDISPEYADEIALSFGDTRNHVDALAIGPYFGTDLAADAAGVARIRKMSLDELMRELKTSSLPKAKAEMLAHAKVARKYGLPMIAYEGGQHLWNMSGQAAPELDALFNAANRDPRMGALYSKYLNDWAEADGGLFMHELDCGSFEGMGNWGALEYLTQPRAEAPKYDALRRFMEGN